MSDDLLISVDGKRKLEEELGYLKRDKRKAVAERISTAKEFGDLSENAEYHEAKEEQAFVESRILQLEHILKTARLAKQNRSKTAGIGSVMELKKEGQAISLTLVGATEADPSAGKISIESPIGHSLIGKAKGEKVEILTPNGKMVCQIIEIK